MTEASSYRDLPGFKEDFAEAFRRQQSSRDAASIPCWENVCGVFIRLPTIDDLAVLDFTDNPFVCGGEIHRGDCLAVLWLLSPRFLPEQGSRFRCWQAKQRRSRFVKSLRKVSTARMIIELTDFFDKMFMDAGESDPRAQRQMPVASLAAYYIYFFGVHMHWTPETVRKLVLPEFFQILNLLSKHLSEKGGTSFRIINPLTDRVERHYKKLWREMQDAKRN